MNKKIFVNKGEGQMKRNILKILNLKNNSFIHIIRIEENEVIIWKNSTITNEHEN